jgi:signal transduction histidine kinase
MTAHSRDNPRRRTKTLKLGIIVALTSVVLTIWAVVAGSIISARQSVIESTRHDAADLAGIFGASVSRTFDSVAGAMGIVVTRMRAPGSNLDLYSWAHDLPVIDGTTVQAVIVDSTGRLIASSSEPHPQPVDLGDRNEFRAVAGNAGDDVIIGHAAVGQQSQFLVTLSHRVAGADGRFLGVVIFFVAPSDLTSLRDSVDIGTGGAVRMIGPDHTILAGIDPSDPSGLALVGKPVPDGVYAMDISSGAQGYYVESGDRDASYRLHAYDRLDKYTVIVDTSLDLGAALAPQRQQTIILVILAGIGTLVLGGLAVILLREVGHRAEREIQLADERMLLQAANARLAEERIRLRQINFELKHSKERAESANEAKSQFLANMSHELRTPLNAIIGFSQIIKEQTMGPIGELRYADYANDILCAGEHLLALINNVLDISKIQAGKLSLKEEPIDLHETVQGSLAAVSAQALKNHVVLHVDLPANLPPVRADAVAMRQILINLLSNAVKFTPEGGEVTVSIEPEKDGGIALVIADTGIGMDEDEIVIALEPFRQVENALTKKYDGTGLGLPIARRLVELHGGRLEIASAKNIGTLIRAHLPPERVLAAQQAA